MADSFTSGSDYVHWYLCLQSLYFMVLQYSKNGWYKKIILWYDYIASVLLINTRPRANMDALLWHTKINLGLFQKCLQWNRSERTPLNCGHPLYNRHHYSLANLSSFMKNFQSWKGYFFTIIVYQNISIILCPITTAWHHLFLIQFWL